MKATVDFERARVVVSRLDFAFKHKLGLLSETEDLVENQIPDGISFLSREHALFLFYIVANDHGMKSLRLYLSAKSLFRSAPHLFDPFRVVESFDGPTDQRLIDWTGRSLGTRYPRVTAKNWFLNSSMLIEKFAGDPRAMFTSTSDARVLIKLITEFHGYGPKIGGMLLRAAIGLGFAKVAHIDEVLVPVDIHDSRISVYTGILSCHDDGPDGRIDYYSYARQVQQILLQACNSSGFDWLDTDRALWLIGSRGCVTKRCRLCPLCDICSVGKRIEEEAEQSSTPALRRKKRPRVQL